MHPTIPSILGMQPPAQISGFAGRISMVFPVLANTRPQMQNFVIQDEETGQEIRAMLIGYPALDETRHRGGYIEIEAGDPDSVVYKPQKDRQQRPQPNKIEIKQTAKIVQLLRVDENHGPLSRQRTAQAAAPHPAPSLPSQPVLPKAIVPESQPAAHAPRPMTKTVEQHVWALGAVYRMCAESAAWALSLEGKGEPAVERLNSATGTIFVQATRDGLHHQLDAGAFYREHANEIADRFFKPVVERPPTAKERMLAAIPESARPRAIEVLVATGKLKPGGTLVDLAEADAELCLGNGFIQLLTGTAA